MIVARAKFEISNEKDSDNFFRYMLNKKGMLYTEMYSCKDYKDNNQRDDECTIFSGLYDKIIDWQYKINTPLETRFAEETELLYMLPYSRIEKIKTSIRAKRKNKYEKKKRQLTIDDHVHLDLSIYAKRYNITLSEAIEKLLLKNTD